MHQRAGKTPRRTMRGMEVVVYRASPTTFLGRLLAFLLTVFVLVAAFFFSLIIFSIVFVVVLFFLAYASWVFWRSNQRQARRNHL